MSDTYIDYAETQTYGSFFIEAATAADVFHPFLGEMARVLGVSTRGVAGALFAAGMSEQDLYLSSSARAAELTEGETLLSRAYHWALGEGRIDLKAVFPQGRNGIENTTQGVKDGLEAVAHRLGAFLAVPGAKERQAELLAHAKRLSGAMERNGKSHGRKNKATPELIAARKEWLRVYRGVKEVVHGLLAMRFPMEEVESRMKTFFRDLSVAAHRGTGRASSLDEEKHDSAEAPAAPHILVGHVATEGTSKPPIA